MQDEQNLPPAPSDDPVTHPEIPELPNPTEPEPAQNPYPVSDPLPDEPTPQPVSDPQPDKPGDIPPRIF